MQKYTQKQAKNSRIFACIKSRGQPRKIPGVNFADPGKPRPRLWSRGRG